MKKLNRDELLSVLSDIHLKGTIFLNNASDALKGETFSNLFGVSFARDE